MLKAFTVPKAYEKIFVLTYTSSLADIYPSIREIGARICRACRQLWLAPSADVTD